MDDGPLVWHDTADGEDAAALIAAGARLDICNHAGWTAADYARGGSAPSFLQQGLEGNRWNARVLPRRPMVMWRLTCESSFSSVC